MLAVYLWMCLFLFLAVGLIAGIQVTQETRVRSRLRREGLSGEAVILQHRVVGTPPGGKAYAVRYRYQAHGHSYEREERVSAKRYKTLLPGTRMGIRYLPQNPYVARMEDHP